MLACEPMTYTEIADKLNITVQTLWNYKQHAELNREVGKISANENRIWMETRLAIELKKYGFSSSLKFLNEKYKYIRSEIALIYNPSTMKT